MSAVEGAGQKAVPEPDPDSAPYWEAAKKRRLSLERCNACAGFVHPPGPGCPNCGSDDLGWSDLGSDIHGTIHSMVTVYRAFTEGFQGDTPYVAALCEVDGAPGVRILGNIGGVDVTEVEIGARVKMIWEDRAPDGVLPQWALDGEAPKKN